MKTKIYDRFELELLPHRASDIDWSTWERRRMLKIKEVMGTFMHLRPLVVYVGAEEGDMPALIASWGAVVDIIEPDETAWPNIKATFLMNDLVAQRKFVGFASDSDSHVKLDDYIRWPSEANGDISIERKFRVLGEHPDIPRITLDTFEQGCEVDIISIDVEGDECRVIDGAIKLIERNKPHLFISVHPELMYAKNNVYSSDFRAKVKSLGYEEELLDYQHEAHLHYIPL